MPSGLCLRGAVAKAAWLIVLAALAAVPDRAAAQVDAPPPAAQTPDERPLLWRGLRAGMSPRDVVAALRRQNIRAELAIDQKNGREFVETPRAISWAGRPYLIAMGFVEGGLFYVTVNSHRMLAGRVAFERSHFSRVAALLAADYGQPLAISSEPLVSNVERLSVNTVATARFERGGVRADLTGSEGFLSYQRDVSESVTVRFWRVADAEAYAASQRVTRPDPEPEPAPEPAVAKEEG